MIRALNFKVVEKSRYVLRGGDVYIQDMAKETLKKSAEGDFFGLNFSYFNSESSIDEIEGFCSSSALFGTRLAIISRAKNVSRDEQARILKIFQDGSDDILLAVLDLDGEFKFLDKHAEIVDCSRLTPDEAQRFVLETAEREGFETDVGAARTLYELTDGDTSRIASELSKMFCYFERPYTITKADVTLHVASSAEYKIFDFTNAVTDGKNERALFLACSMVRSGESPTAMLSVLSGSYRRMLSFSLSKESENTLSSLYGVKPFAVEIARRNAKKYGAKKLKDICDMLYNAEYRIKTGAVRDRDALFESIGLIMIGGK